MNHGRWEPGLPLILINLLKTGRLTIDDLTVQKEDFPQVRKADHRAQEDALQIEWSGESAGSVWAIQDFVDIEDFEENDLSEYTLSDGSLKFNLMLESGNPLGLRLGMGCSLNTMGCGGEVDLGSSISVEKDTGIWRSFNVELECFARRGMDFTKVVAPFSISSDKDLNLLISDIRIVAGPGNAKPAECELEGFLD